MVVVAAAAAAAAARPTTQAHESRPNETERRIKLNENNIH